MQSMILVRTLLRTGVSTIAYIRNMFPEEDFDDIVFNKMPMKALKPAHELTQLLENGAIKFATHCIQLISCTATRIYALAYNVQAHLTLYRKAL